jgi:hypothetical protein
MDMSEAQTRDPIACSLPVEELADRGAAWRKVCRHATASEQVPGGVRITFGPVTGVSESLRELARLEADCCPWMEFVIDDEPEGGARLVVTAQSEEGAGAIRPDLRL